MTRHLRIALSVIIAGVGLMIVNSPAAQAHGSCPASASVVQAPPTILNPNPTVTWQGGGSCSTPHVLDGQSTLYLDGVQKNSFAWGKSGTYLQYTDGTGPNNYQPQNVCWNFDITRGPAHTWRVDTTFYHGELINGVEVNWESPTYASASLTFYCPHLL